MTLDTTTLLYIVGGFTVVLGILVVRLELKLRKFLLGKNAATLEDSIADLDRRAEEFAAFRKEIEKYLEGVERRLKQSVSGVETVRFNPFKGSSGSNQSFATAFLNEHGDGVIISSLYSRDRVSVYAKPVENRTSAYELTEEEKQAIAKATARK